MMNVLRYCNLDESLQGEPSLVCDSTLERLCRTKELDYMSYIVFRLFENTEVRLSHLKLLPIRHIPVAISIAMLLPFSLQYQNFNKNINLLSLMDE